MPDPINTQRPLLITRLISMIVTGYWRGGVYKRISDLYTAQGQNELALQAYQNAYLADSQSDFRLAQKIANQYLRAGQPDQALAIYNEHYPANSKHLCEIDDGLVGQQMILARTRTIRKLPTKNCRMRSTIFPKPMMLIPAGSSCR